MQRNQVRQIVSAQFYQSLAESGVEVTAVPQNQLQTIVNALADGVFAALDAIEEENFAEGTVPTPRAQAEVSPAAAPDGDDEEIEEVLWKGRPYLTISVRYELTSQRLRVFHGILGQRLEEIELVRVRDTQVKQHAGERAINVGDITIFSTDPSTPEIVLSNVSDPVAVRELIRTATLEEKNRRGLYYREEM